MKPHPPCPRCLGPVLCRPGEQPSAYRKRVRCDNCRGYHPPCHACGEPVLRRPGEDASAWHHRVRCDACIAAGRIAAPGSIKSPRLPLRHQDAAAAAPPPSTPPSPAVTPIDEAAAIAAWIAAKGGREAIRVKTAYCLPTQAGLVGKAAATAIKNLRLDALPTWQEQRVASAHAAGLPRIESPAK